MEIVAENICQLKCVSDRDEGKEKLIESMYVKINSYL